MTNAEKYLKDGVDKEKFCYELARHLNATVGNDEARTKEFMAIVDYFLDCLCVPTLTEDERVILRNIGERWKFIARDNLNRLYVRTGHKKDCETICPFDHLFQFIKERRRIFNRGTSFW